MVSNLTLSVEINQLLTGKISLFGPNDELSAINKKNILEPIFITKLGLKGDEQADLRVHGGIDKAIHHFPAEHYATLLNLLPQITFSIGGFGENLSSYGVTEKEVCFGDIFSLGTATVQLSQGRQPCWKLDTRFQYPTMAKLVQKHSLTGWYYRVVEEGMVSPGDRLTLLDRSYPQANLDRVMRLLHREPMRLDEFQELSELSVIPSKWRKIFLKRLESGVLEDTSRRLNTPTKR